MSIAEKLVPPKKWIEVDPQGKVVELSEPAKESLTEEEVKLHGELSSWLLNVMPKHGLQLVDVKFLAAELADWVNAKIKQAVAKSEPKSGPKK